MRLRACGENGATDPDRVLALRWGDDLDLHGRRGQRLDLLLDTVGDTRVHGGAAGHDDVAVQVLTDVDVALHDRVVGELVSAGGLHAEERRLEEGLRAAEALVADGDDLAVRQLVGLLQLGGVGGLLHLGLEVAGDVGELLLDVTHNLALRRGGERVAGLGQKLGSTQWLATLEARFDPEVGRVIWHVLTGTLRRPGEENLARDRIEMEQEILDKLGVKRKSKASRRFSNADSGSIENPVTYEPDENSSEYSREVPF